MYNSRGHGLCDILAVSGLIMLSYLVKIAGGIRLERFKSVLEIVHAEYSVMNMTQTLHTRVTVTTSSVEDPTVAPEHVAYEPYLTVVKTHYGVL